MPRWNNDLPSNTKSIMENTIKNVHPALYEHLLTQVVTMNLPNNKRIIETHIRTETGIVTAATKHSRNYWLLRGWSDAESYVRAKEHKRTNTKSVFSRDFWLSKINPMTGNNYTEDEADVERNSRRPIRKEYWIKQGYSVDGAIEKAKLTKQDNNARGSIGSAKSDKRRITSTRCIEYYLARGFSEKEANDRLSDSQKYFSKEICIKQHGGEEGIRVWQARQDRWQATLDAKSDEEKSRINRLKISKGITVSKAERLILLEIYKFLPNVQHQFTLVYQGKKQYIYDIQANNKIIEYNGDFWHCNPAKYPPKYVNPRTKVMAEDKWRQDNIKVKYAESQGYEVLVVWEAEFKQNKEDVINRCVTFLTQ